MHTHIPYVRNIERVCVSSAHIIPLHILPLLLLLLSLLLCSVHTYNSLSLLRLKIWLMRAHGHKRAYQWASKRAHTHSNFTPYVFLHRLHFYLFVHHSPSSTRIIFFFFQRQRLSTLLSSSRCCSCIFSFSTHNVYSSSRICFYRNGFYHIIFCHRHHNTIERPFFMFSSSSSLLKQSQANKL